MIKAIKEFFGSKEGCDEGEVPKKIVMPAPPPPTKKDISPLIDKLIAMIETNDGVHCCLTAFGYSSHTIRVGDLVLEIVGGELFCQRYEEKEGVIFLKEILSFGLTKDEISGLVSASDAAHKRTTAERNVDARGRFSEVLDGVDMK